MISLEDYLKQGPMTDPRQHSSLYADLPGDLRALVSTLEGLVVHVFWAEDQGLSLDETRKAEVTLRATWQKFDRLLTLDGSVLPQARPMERKLVCNCRDYTVLLVSMLRYLGIPARSRCGFGTYFIPGHYEDHWVAEVWNAEEARWQMADAQLNDFMCQAMHIEFDTLDMPKGQFVTAGEAWQLCRSGKADPKDFGIFDMHGWGFIWGNVVRDFLALNRVEILPWDGWKEVGRDFDHLSEQGWKEIDRLAEWITHPDECYADILSYYADHTEYRPPFLQEYL